MFRASRWAVAALCAAPLAAQQQPAPSPFAAVVGAVIDSIHGGPLIGATVIVSGIDRQGTVDSTGRFRIDSIPPGDYVLGVFHPLLDSLNVSLASKSLTFPAGVVTTVIMAVPSAPSVIATFCSADERQKGQGAVLGKVLAADSDDPIAGAMVRYTMTSKSPKFLATLTFIADAKSKQDGSFVLCGLPTNGGGTVHAQRGDVVTGDVIADVSKWRFASVTVRLDTLKRGTAVVLGRIVDDKGRPASHVDVGLAGSRSHATTSDSGTFALRDLPAGSQTIQIRRVGYAAVDTALMLSSKTPVQIAMALRPAAVTLSTVNVHAVRQAALERVGFEHRRKIGAGHYLTQDQIQHSGAIEFSDLARTMPGLIVRPARNGQQVVLQGRGALRGGCLVYMIDRAPFTDQPLGTIDTYVRPEDIIGIEFYQPSEAPLDLVVAPPNCSIIVIWTRATSNGN